MSADKRAPAGILRLNYLQRYELSRELIIHNRIIFVFRNIMITFAQHFKRFNYQHKIKEKDEIENNIVV